MASNTSILIKRSLSSSTPTSLKDGELAYSYASNTLFIGNANTMFGYDVIGGEGLLDSLSANLTIGDSSSNTANINLQSDTLTFRGTGGISANVVSNMFGESEVVISANTSTFLQANTGSSFQTQVISTNLQVDGDLIVNGTTTTINSTTVSTGDTILVLANNNTTGDSVDSGFVTRYNDGSSNLFSGLVRDSGQSGEYALFKDYEDMGMGGQFTDISISTLNSNETMSGMPGARYATLHARIDGPSVTTPSLRTTATQIQLGSGTVSDSYGVAIGYNATANTGAIMAGFGGEAVAIGYQAGYGVLAGNKSVAIGSSAQATATGGIAIGYGAQASGNNAMGTTGSIVLNASTMAGLTSSQEGFYVNPVREVYPENFDINDGIAMYNFSTKEMRYTRTLDGGEF
jgi:hypothetical protein